uniref:TrbI/VirB10 family protein n=1 Tax=Yersinia kristensenii TaxID=28152 RepID=UPI000CC0A10B
MWSRKKQGQPAAPKAGIAVDPKQSYLGGRVSKKVMWLGGLLTALILSFVVTVIAGKGQRAAEAEAVTTKSGNDNQMGLNDILSSAPSTNVVMQTPATPSASTTSPGKTGAAQGNTGGASPSPEEDPSIRQARLAAERETLRIVQLKQQQFEAALASNGRVNVELDDKAQANASPQDKYQQALADLKAAQNSLQAASAQPDPNKQDSKIAFTEDRHSNTYLTRGRETPLSPLELKIGTVIPATLISGINSDLPGQVIAQVNQNVYDTATHSTILLPQGSKL